MIRKDLPPVCPRNVHCGYGMARTMPEFRPPGKPRDPCCMKTSETELSKQSCVGMFALPKVFTCNRNKFDVTQALDGKMLVEGRQKRRIGGFIRVHKTGTLEFLRLHPAGRKDSNFARAHPGEENMLDHGNNLARCPLQIQIIQNQKRGRLQAAQAGFLPPHAGYRTPSGAKKTRKVEKKNVFVEALEQLEQDSNRQVGFARAGAAHE